MRAAAPQLHLRYDEPERRPSTRRHGALEPAPCVSRITVHQVPVADSKTQRRHLDVAGIGGREKGNGSNPPPLQAEPPRPSVSRGLRVREADQPRPPLK